MQKMVLIDGNSLLNRAFYATPVFTTKDGLPTNGIFGFVKLLLKIISDKSPDYVAVAFDLRAPTFRHQIYTEYKAGRKSMPDELAVQVPVLKELLKTMGIKIFEQEGYEADDIIGTLAKTLPAHAYIYTGDRDAYQLVDETTNVCYTRKGVSDLLELTAENFQDEIGITPAQVIDLKALMGDKSDNIPGVVGVGEKSAMTLITKYGSLDGVYEHLDEITGALHKKLEENKEIAYFSKRLATIVVDAPIQADLSDCVLKMPFRAVVKEKFAELEFKSLLVKNIFESEERVAEVAPSVEKESDLQVTEVLATLEDGLAILKDRRLTIACAWDDAAFQFTVLESGNSLQEYVYPLKSGLLDVGYFEDHLISLYKAVFSAQNNVIAYNVKGIMRRLKTFDVAFLSSYDDVSILKCLSDGLGNTDGLDFCLNYYALSLKQKAYGTYWLYTHYFKTLNEEERKLYQEIELPLVNVLFAMENQGVCVDESALYKFSEKYHAELSRLVEKIYVLAGERFNVNSTQQLGKILFEKLKIGKGVKKNKDSKNYKTTAEELEKYSDVEIVSLLLRYRKIQKINSTYIEGFKPLIRKGKLHTTYHQSSTLTGRLSSSNPNLQNIPIRTEEGKELRKLFVASEGNVLIDADYSQIELRLLAHFSGCKELIQAYCENKDIHAITASQVFNVPLESVTQDQRRNAKAVNFGIIYGISAFGLGNDLNITSRQAQEYISRYFESYSDVKTYMNSNVEKANANGYVKTLLGRRRVINEVQSGNRNVKSFGERAAMNMPLQGSSADIIKIAMIGVYNKLNAGGYKAKLVMQIHDELVIDCPKEEVDEVAKILQTEMENAVSLKVPLTVEIQVGKNWFETK